MKVLLTLCLMLLAACLPLTGLAQTTEFTYQGELTDSGAQQPTYQMRFRLFGAAVGGSPIGSAVENPAVAVDGGIFTVTLNFGSAVFTGADRYLEIAVRRDAGESYTVLDPRQKIASSPYAIRTLSAQTADVALNAQNLGGVPANQYLTTSSNAFIRNGATLQDAEFNIDGNGLIGGTFGVGTSLIDPFFRLDVLGTARVMNNAAAHVVTETTGGDNSWARFYMRTRDSQTSNLIQSWFMGTSRNFIGNQFYLGDESGNQTRMSIQPFGGSIAFPIGNVGIGTNSPGARLAVSTDTNSPGNNTAYFEAPTIGPNASNVHFGTTGDWYIRSAANNGKVVLQDTGGNVGIGTSNPNAKLSLVGSATQDHNSRGFPKAMLFVLANGTISRCYNGTNGSNTSGCGFVPTNPSVGAYTVNFGFDISQAFVVLTTFGDSSRFAGRIWTVGLNNTTLGVTTFSTTDESALIPSDFFLIVY